MPIIEATPTQVDIAHQAALDVRAIIKHPLVNCLCALIGNSVLPFEAAVLAIGPLICILDRWMVSAIRAILKPIVFHPIDSHIVCPHLLTVCQPPFVGTKIVLSTS